MSRVCEESEVGDKMSNRVEEVEIGLVERRE